MSEHDPTTCYICTRQADGLGLSPKPPYNWICRECAVTIDDLSRVKRPSAYELQARQGGVDAAAPLVAEYGADLSQWDETQVELFVGAVWKGCADRLRDLVKEGSAPF